MLEAAPEGAAYLTAAGSFLMAVAAIISERASARAANALRDKVNDIEARVRVLESKG